MMNDPQKGRDQGHVTYFGSNGTDTRVPQKYFLLLLLLLFLVPTITKRLIRWALCFGRRQALEEKHCFLGTFSDGCGASNLLNKFDGQAMP